jgi:hypothetical protein
MRLKVLHRCIYVMMLLSVSLLRFSVSSAQEDADRSWRYGFRRSDEAEGGQVLSYAYKLVAYTLDGQTAEVMSIQLAEPSRPPYGFDLYPLDAEHHLLWVNDANGGSLYALNGPTATLIDTQVVEKPIIISVYGVIDYRYPYTVLDSMSGPIILDLETHSAEIPDSLAASPTFDCCFITPDNKLQYVAEENVNGVVFKRFRQRDLQTDEETVLMEFPPALTSMSVNRADGRWLFSISNQDFSSVEMVVWNTDGDQHWESFSTAMHFQWLGNNLYWAAYQCPKDCPLSLEAPDGEINTYTVDFPTNPQDPGRYFIPYALRPDGSLIGELSNPSEWVKISPDGTLQSFGFHKNGQKLTEPSGGSLISLDGRYVAVTTDLETEDFAIIDTETGEAVISSTTEGWSPASFVVINIIYHDHGFALSGIGDEPVLLYHRTSDQHRFDFLPGLNIVETSDDSTLLTYRWQDTYENGDLVLYNLDTGQIRVVVENLQPFFID